MSLLIYLLFFVAIFHFVYESILLPSFRLELRYKLFTLRDEARMLKIKHSHDFSDEAFLHVQHSINASINLLPFMTPSLIADAKREFENNSHLRAQIQKRTEILEACKLEDVREIIARAGKYSFNSLLLNTGGWLIYILPVFIIALPILFFIGTFKKIKKLILSLMVVPDYQINKLLPQAELSMA